MAFKLLVSVLYILLRVYLEKGGVPGKKRGAAPPLPPFGGNTGYILLQCCTCNRITT